MIDNKDRILAYMNEFTKKYGYTPTIYQIANELYLAQDKVASIVDVLKAEGTVKIHRPCS